MKLVYYIFAVIFLSSCAIEDPTACFEGTGKQVTKTMALKDFSRLLVREGIELTIKQGVENSLKITYSEHLLSNISVEVINERLLITNNNECKFFTGFSPAAIEVTAVNVSEIRNASQYTIASKDTLRFDALTIISEDFNEKEVNVGDFDLNINNRSITIVTNNVSNFSISGKTQYLNINFASGQGKLLADNLEAQTIFLFHRGTNDLLVNPISEIKGEIRGTGNVIAINRPSVVDVTEFYTGKLIFRD